VEKKKKKMPICKDNIKIQFVPDRKHDVLPLETESDVVWGNNGCLMSLSYGTQICTSLPSFVIYGSETWTIKARNTRRITAAEMKYVRRTAGYIWTDYKTNKQTAKELKITPILDKLLEHVRNWIQHVNRMPRNGLPRVMKHYSPTGRRNYGRPLKRLLGT
jgi:hypothetical protein